MNYDAVMLHNLMTNRGIYRNYVFLKPFQWSY